MLQGLRDEQLEAIEHVLEHHELVALVHDAASGVARMVGRVSPDLRTAFFTLRQSSPATVVLAERLGWAVERAAVGAARRWCASAWRSAARKALWFRWPGASRLTDPR